MEDYAMITKFKLTEILDVDFYIPMPESWSKKKKESMCGKPHQNKPDLDNILKFIMDTLLPEGDQNVHTIVAKKLWDYEGKIIFRDANDQQ